MSARYAPFTIAMLAICWLVFGLTSLGAGGDEIVRRYALIPGDVAAGQWWRIISGGFLHANFTHILFNSIALYQSGLFVEFAYGTPRFAAIYVVALLTGGIAAYLSTLGSDVATIGASGAIMGIFGAMAVLAFKLPSLRQALLQSAIVPIVLTLGYGFSHANISNAGHIGGIVGGALTALVLSPARGRMLAPARE